MTKKLKKLPVGIQDFCKLIEGNYIYVDKTKYIYDLIENGSYYFLSRPRRFGKSLLVNTMAELFRANKKLFKGLWIEDKIDWKQHPVLHFDFSHAGYKDIGLEAAIKYMINNIAEKYDIKIKNTGVGLSFEELIKKLSEKNPVVILVDEYDKPIIDYLDKKNIHKAHEHREILKNFYSVLKGNDAHIRFFFMTGVSKFSKVSVFSDLNNLNDITVHKRYSSMLGYTQKEIEHYFDGYLDLYGKKQKKELVDNIRKWYDGYSWDGENTLYNPFSVLRFFDSGEFENYWFATGTPTFLIKLARERAFYLKDLENLKVQHIALDKFNIDELELIPLLFQTGYLTIHEYDTKRNIYTLGFPNREVDNAFANYLLAEFNRGNVSDTNAIITGMSLYLENADIEEFMENFKSLFAGLSHYNIDKKEKYFHSMFHLIIKMLGYIVDSEVSVIKGRIDSVIRTEKYIYIIEFKLGTAKQAMAQIKEKQYHQQYLSEKKTVYLLAIGFDAKKKNVGDYLVEKI